MNGGKILKFIQLVPIYLTLLVSFSAIAALPKMVVEDEKNSVSIFQNTVKSVVNVSTIKRRRNPWAYGDVEMQAGAGTGFVWDNKGHIVTNYHVVQNGNKFNISFHNDKNLYEATIVGVEPKKDIAVLKLKKMPSKLIPVKVGVSKNLMVGLKAVAIGNPFGLDHTMTAGIISALDRKIEGIGGVKIHGMIQTDASINPGNSGGPLLNSSGEIIGMNTVIYSGSGTSAGVGFAVPVDTIKRIVPELIEHGKVTRPGLGIGLMPDHMKARFGIEKGIVITYIDENGGASEAGLVGMGQDRWGRVYLGDVILEINGEEVNTYDDIYHVLDKYKIGDIVKVKILREDQTKTVKITLTEL